ncbi:hypothetical protein [Rhizobium sp. 1399]|jgi:hypothetical protein|uniref:hypothetical protein n=1 Tax=Rhizobium sp. 1399 TaxID=2817758 RepID=UPI002859AC9A|nr:hypothetical protein [Rhizobium sp. 1399]MDR6667918.1 hypothetical protein [Rhizobium sp. 1399]
MRQTKPFIVEIEQPRKPKALARKSSIWGDLDLSRDQDLVAVAPTNEPASASDGTGD